MRRATRSRRRWRAGGHGWRRCRRIATNSVASAREAGLSEWRREALGWTLVHDRTAAASQLSLVELLWLGAPRPSEAAPLDPWGAAVLPLTGAMAVQMPRARAWEEVSGRAALGLLSTRGVDIAVAVAEALAARHLPGSLAPGVIAFAMQDAIDGARLAYFDDWSAFSRAARGITPDRMADYIAALTAGGPLVPADQPGEAATLTGSWRSTPSPGRNRRHGDRRLLLVAVRTDPAPALRIAAPTEGTLRQRLDPPGCDDRSAGGAEHVTQLTFFADGRQVCAAQAAAFRVRLGRRRADDDHQIGAVASLKSGDRLVQSIRHPRAPVLRRRKRRRHTGHRGRHLGRRSVRAGADQERLPRIRGRPAAANHQLRVRGHSARARRRDRRELEHDGSASSREGSRQAVSRGLQPTDKATVLSFNDNIFTVAPRGAAAETRVQAIDRMRPWGGTALYDVIIKALDLSRTPRWPAFGGALQRRRRSSRAMRRSARRLRAPRAATRPSMRSVRDAR